MDPLSITASAFTFVGACRKLVAGFRFVKDLSNAPAEITEISEELRDLEHVLTAIGLVTTQRNDDVFEVLLSPLFVKVDHILEELCTICGVCSQRLKHDAAYVEALKVQLRARFKWTREKGRVGGLQDRLKVLRLDFANQLAAISLLDLAQLRSDVKSLSLKSECAETVSTPVVDACVDQPPDCEEKSSEMQIPMGLPSAVNTEKSPWQNHVSVQSRCQLQESAARDPNALQVIKACSCACHTLTRIKTPLMLQTAFGSLLIKSNGLYGSPACNEFSCHCRSNARIHVSYRFPEWLLRRVVSSVILSNSLSGPQLSLAMPRVVSYTSDIFVHAISGNIQGIMTLFEKGLAAPSDVNDTWGYSALHYAVDKGHIDLCKFLLKAGARPDVQDLDENSVTDLAWNQICLKTIPPAKAAAFQEMFEKDEWLEARQFTTLHKIVLNQAPTPRDLAQELSNSTQIIDIADSEGRTPLSWAAEVGDAQAVETLLKFGASTSTKSIIGLTPLHYAARGPNPICMDILLNHGASVSAKNKWDQSPLSLAAYFQNDPSFIRLLLEHGADIHEKDFYGSSALFCTSMNNDRTARYLISRGADINSRDKRNGTPLFDTIESNSHQCITLLLDSGADLALTDINGETALHLLARRGDLCTLKIFLAADLGVQNLNPDVTNNDGFTAKDVMTRRIDSDPDLEMAFQQLLAKLDPMSNTAQFYDALEEPWAVCDKGPLVDVTVKEVCVE